MFSRKQYKGQAKFSVLKKKKKDALKISLLPKYFRQFQSSVLVLKSQMTFIPAGNVSGISVLFWENKDECTVFSLAYFLCPISQRELFQNFACIVTIYHQSHHVQLQKEETDLKEAALNWSYFVHVFSAEKTKQIWKSLSWNINGLHRI